MKFVSIIWSSLIKEEKQKVLVLFLLMLVGMGLEMIGIGLMVPLLLSMSGESGLFEDLPVIH